jgi:glycosyltransferase involved in cell wall biosynthesis
MPKVSVLIPVYNVEKFIRRCLESVMNQSLTDIEIIVVNDFTPDNSMAIVHELAGVDDRIQIIENEKNRGLMVARQVAYVAAKGDYITFCDSDDTMPKDALKDLYEAAVDSGADIVAGAMEFVSIKGERKYKGNKLSYGSDSIAMYRSMLTGEMNQNLCSKLYKRELLQGYEYVTLEDATCGEDGNLNYQVAEHIKKCVTIDSAVYEYRQNEESTTNTPRNEKALISIAHLQKLRYDLALRHPEIKKLLFRKISYIYLESKITRDNYGSYYKEVGLESFTNVFKCLMRQKFLVALKLIASYVKHKIFN